MLKTTDAIIEFQDFYQSCVGSQLESVAKSVLIDIEERPHHAPLELAGLLRQIAIKSYERGRHYGRIEGSADLGNRNIQTAGSMSNH